MDDFVDERDYKLLENDKYTFFVLGRIMGGECDLLLTDHEKLIICYSCNPYPVWIWTPDGVAEEEKEKIRSGNHFLWRNAEDRNVAVCPVRQTEIWRA